MKRHIWTLAAAFLTLLFQAPAFAIADHSGFAGIAAPPDSINLSNQTADAVDKIALFDKNAESVDNSAITEKWYKPANLARHDVTRGTPASAHDAIRLPNSDALIAYNDPSGIGLAGIGKLTSAYNNPSGIEHVVTMAAIGFYESEAHSGTSWEITLTPDHAFVES